MDTGGVDGCRRVGQGREGLMGKGGLDGCWRGLWVKEIEC